jgi:RND family efflux transporter MFP subunit
MNTTQTPQRGRVLTGLICATALGACAPPAEPPPVRTAVYVSVVHNTSGPVERVLSGSLRPRIEADLSFRVGGTLTQRAVELGQAVRAGQVLARIDAADVALALEAAIAQQQAAAVDAEQAASDAARFSRLRADGSVGAADAERQQARADAAAARLAQAQQQVALARNRAGYAVLTAPFDGVVTSLRLEAGQSVGENQPVLSLARPGALELQADIPEALAADLERWQASLRLPRRDGAVELPLRLRELAPTAANASRTYRARYALPAVPDEAALRMGMTAELRLTQPGDRVGADLPVSALLATPGLLPAAGADAGPIAAVWRVDPATGALQHTPVQLLAQGSDRVSVLGLPDGALVVSVGAQKLDAGMTVRPVSRPLDPPLPATPAPAAPSTARSVAPEVLR